jgi:hypothetical protein
MLLSLVVAALAAAPSGHALDAGPVLAGNAVVWDERAADVHTLRLWTARTGAKTVYQANLDSIGALVGSQSTVAFTRGYSGACPSGSVCPQLNDTLAGAPNGPFRRVGAVRKCVSPFVDKQLAVARRTVVVFAPDCATTNLVVSVHELARERRATIIGRGRCCGGVRAAGRYVAWTSGPDTIRLYDRRLRRVVSTERPLGAELRDFDLQADGKIAAATERGVLWQTPFDPGRRPIHLNADRVRMAADKIVVGNRTELDLVSLAGRVRRLTRFAKPVEPAGNLDFDGTRMTWATRTVTSSRVDCPPKGEGRPCVQLRTGFDSVWLLRLGQKHPKLLVKLPFTDLSG